MNPKNIFGRKRINKEWCLLLTIFLIQETQYKVSHATNLKL